jgi:Rieske Fe-S protein
VPGIAISHRWSGQVIETADGLPYIGEVTPREIAGTGFSGNGMTFGTLTGMFVHDAWAGRTHPWRDLFDPGRTVIRGGVWDYVAENKDYPYYLVRDRFAGVESRPVRSVAPGTAKILARDGKPTAVFRDESGALTMCSALCTHMGCLVAWNQAERTWDCPCHGSRFTPEGAVISGPAEKPLDPVT